MFFHYIANDIKKTTMSSSFTYFAAQNYLNNNQNISQCTIPRQHFQLFYSAA